MIRSLSAVFSLFFFLHLESTSVALNMIVKDESHVIRRCLESVKPLINYWVIVDTGSTDGTQHLIHEYLAEIPGELHERPWVNFGHNRNEALQLAQGKADYILFMDADDYLVFSKEFQLPELTADAYSILIENYGLRYARTHLIKNSLPWEWHGVVHEYVGCTSAQAPLLLEGVTNFVMTEGSRSRDPEKYRKDAALLEADLQNNPTNRRSVFYLAQSYRDAGEPEKAIHYYKQRASMGGWDQEIFWSLFQIGRIHEEMGADLDIVARSYELAHAYRPSRAEPLYHLAKLYRSQGDYEKAYEAAKKGSRIPLPQDILFVENWVYDYGLLFELSIASYYVGYPQLALQLCEQLQKKENLFDDFRDFVCANEAKIYRAFPILQTQVAPYITHEHSRACRVEGYALKSKS